MKQGDGNLLHRVKHHDWESMETRDLMERIDLVKELRLISFKELAEIINAVSTRTGITIVDFVKRSRA